jgi:hypothetical protein
MNGRYAFFYLVSLLVIIGCNNHSRGDILTEPPFATITDSIKRFPGVPELLLRRGQLLSQHDQHELAYYDFKAAWEAHPSDSTGMAYVSNLFLVNRLGNAVNVLEEAVKKFPGNPSLGGD